MTKDRWFKLMESMGLPPSEECFDSLCSAYSETHRYYHTGSHIDAMLRNFDITLDLSEHPYETELAIWFHDAIYKPLSSTNEIDSANWAKGFLSANNYDGNRIERVYRLIMATIHNSDVVEGDEMLIADIDLYILGAPIHVYDEYEQNIRKEYRLIPSIIYRKKRREFLKAFLTQDHIYNLEYFKNKYEQVARENINRAVGVL